MGSEMCIRDRFGVVLCSLRGDRTAKRSHVAARPVLGGNPALQSGCATTATVTAWTTSMRAGINFTLDTIGYFCYIIPMSAINPLERKVSYSFAWGPSYIRWLKQIAGMLGKRPTTYAREAVEKQLERDDRRLSKKMAEETS